MALDRPRLVCAVTRAICERAWGAHIQALVLTGSLARNEGTFVAGREGCLLLGDAEFLVVFGERGPLPTEADVLPVRKRVEEQIARGGVLAEVTLAPVRPGYLRALPPTIFAYELRTCGKTVAGDPTVLLLAPEFSPADIPLEDAWRLLANRIVEQLEGMDELLEGRPTLSPRLHYRTVKLYLDMATSLLVFVGGYAPTYAERARNLAALAAQPNGRTSWPFVLDRFAAVVQTCTEWKLAGATASPDVGRDFWERAVDYAQALWSWELTRLRGSARMPRQAITSRLRGWAHVVRQNGLRRSWSRMPSWATAALRTSPRHAVYATASELLFGLRGSGLTPAARQALLRRLPVTPQSDTKNGSGTWPDVSSDALFNYHRFLVNTRA